jgi:ERCC4-type nuclease
MEKTDMAARLTIEADVRERAGGVLERLAALDAVDLRVSHLPVGDYLLGDDVGVERKTAGDFVSSIVDRRLFRQVEALQAAFPRPILLLEGDPLATERPIHPNAVRGALAYLVAVRGLPIISTAGPDESAALLLTVARQARDGVTPPEGAAKPKAATLAARQEAVVAALPGVGPLLARRLLTHFGSLTAVAAADSAALRVVEGIGPRRAAELAALFAAAYDPGG